MKDQPDLIRDDGTLWVASYGDAGTAMACLFDRSIPQFYFREIERNPRRRWWCRWRPVWRHTGKTWEGHTLTEGGFALYEGEGLK